MLYKYLVNGRATNENVNVKPGDNELQCFVGPFKEAQIISFFFGYVSNELA